MTDEVIMTSVVEEEEEEGGEGQEKGEEGIAMTERFINGMQVYPSLRTLAVIKESEALKHQKDIDAFRQRYVMYAPFETHNAIWSVIQVFALYSKTLNEVECAKKNPPPLNEMVPELYRADSDLPDSEIPELTEEETTKRLQELFDFWMMLVYRYMRNEYIVIMYALDNKTWQFYDIHEQVEDVKLVTIDRCGHCGKAEHDLKKCPRCGEAAYCDQTCLANDWWFHRHYCKFFSQQQAKTFNDQPKERVVGKAWKKRKV